MLNPGLCGAAKPAARVVRLSLLIALLVMALPAVPPARAEGSRDLQADRLFLTTPSAASSSLTPPRAAPSMW